MAALEVCHLRLITSLDESVETCLDEGCDTAAENCLLTEEVCLGLLLEACHENTGPASADTDCICKGDLL